MSDPSIQLRPVVEDDLAMFRRFATEPHLIGLGWAGFRDAQLPARQFAADGYLGPESGRLMVEVEDDRVAAGFVSYRSGIYGGTAQYREIGIVLLPEWRGRGIGWRAQAMLCDYLFSHSPAQRIQARELARRLPLQPSPRRPLTAPVGLQPFDSCVMRQPCRSLLIDDDRAVRDGLELALRLRPATGQQGQTRQAIGPHANRPTPLLRPHGRANRGR